MCGICGSTGPGSTEAVEAMNARLVHRGPDDEGVFADPAHEVALGARRLSIIDVADGHQPVSNEDGTVWAVLNGEIYNHPALIARLRASGHQLRSRCDTEVLVHLYEEYGAELVNALEGMFSFALWDARRCRLVIARDRFGEKPLFLAEQDGELCFASELGALCAVLRSRPQLDAEALDAYFVFGYVPGPRTLVRGVEQLPPGSVLTWERGKGPSIARYWEPAALPSSEVAPLRELVAETEARLSSAVLSRMISDVPLGVFLSGGVDSTLITALATRLTEEPVHTFSVGYDVGDVDETTTARRMAERLGTRHNELRLSTSDVASAVPQLFRRMDQPIADQALVATHAVSRFAREQVTVALAGEGADELFAGYPRYRWLQRGARADVLGPRLRRSVAVGVAGLPGRGRRLADAIRPIPLVERHLDWVTSGRRVARAAVYGPRMQPLALGAQVERDLALRAPDVGGDDPARALMVLDQRQWLVDDVLVKADRAGMLASLEIRTPYLERSLAEFAWSVPTRTHLAGGGKQLLRAVLRRVSPAAARERKTAFRVPAAEWLRGPLSGEVEAISEGRLCSEGWLSADGVRGLADEHLAGDGDQSAVLWPILAASLWFDELLRD